MSCDNPNPEKPDLMPRKPKHDRNSTCVRCRNTDIPGSIIVRHSVYCRSCFLTQLGHKFRRSLEPTINPPEVNPPPGPRRIPLRPVLKATGNLLIGFSGGPASSLLLDLIHETYFTPAQLDPARGTKQVSKRENVWPTAQVAFIDMSAAYPGTPDRTEDARHLVTRYPHFKFIPLRIEHAFDPTWAESVGFSMRHTPMGINLGSEDLPAAPSVPHTTPQAALLTYLLSQPSSSARTTAIRNLTRILLQYTARQTQSSHLLLGTSLTSYAVDLLDAVAIGAGFSIRQVGEETWEGLKIVRPLKEVTDKEVAAGVWWRRVDVMPASVGGGAMHFAQSGITNLTKEFISSLDRDFPSTVHTIARTCEKLAPKGGTGAARCPLCERPVQPGVQAWKTQIAIRAFDPELRTRRAGSPSERSVGIDRGNSTYPRPALSPSTPPTVNPEVCRAHEPEPSSTIGGSSRLNSPSGPGDSTWMGASGQIHSADSPHHHTTIASSITSPLFDPDPLQFDARLDTADPSAPDRFGPDTLAPSLCYACHTQLTSRGRNSTASKNGRASSTSLNAGVGSPSGDEQVLLPVWVRPNLRTVSLPRDVQAYLLDEN